MPVNLMDLPRLSDYSKYWMSKRCWSRILKKQSNIGADLLPLSVGYHLLPLENSSRDGPRCLRQFPIYSLSGTTQQQQQQQQQQPCGPDR